MTPRQKKLAAIRFELLVLCDYDNPPSFAEKDDVRHLKTLKRRGLVEDLHGCWRRTSAGEGLLAKLS